ncbi:MAG TPA: transcription antitermination factor NusB [Spirochaetia bacterium]|nr:MAG: transcription antitermination factor NusB [Spirochaetes bacterium GWB1_36_13]HCL55411.1 transcription antitermination factor NusB [Spirochaetia bacterium]
MIQKKPGARRKARELAVQALYQYDVGNMKKEELENKDWMEKNPIIEKAYSYFKEILAGCLQNLELLDDNIKEFATKYDFKEIMPIDRAILRMGAYLILFEKTTPAVILINEAVEIAKSFSGTDAHKFINGVLDGIKAKLIQKGERTSHE